MKFKRTRSIYLRIILTITLLPVLVCRADDRATDRASLRGIKTIVVKVHTFERDWASELAKADLTESFLLASIERQLEKAGIALVPEEASRRTDTEGILVVRVKFMDPEPPKKTFITAEEKEIQRFDPKKRYVYAIRLNFRQPASLRRTPEATISPITWQTESVGMKRLAMIRKDFEDVANVFIEAYLSENPGN